MIIAISIWLFQMIEDLHALDVWTCGNMRLSIYKTVASEQEFKTGRYLTTRRGKPFSCYAIICYQEGYVFDNVFGIIHSCGAESRNISVR